MINIHLTKRDIGIEEEYEKCTSVSEDGLAKERICKRADVCKPARQPASQPAEQHK